MAKICNKCGLNYRNRATKCVACGSPLTVVQWIRRLKIAAVIVSAVVLIALVVILCINYQKSPDAKVRELIDAYMNNDEETVIDTLPSFLERYDSMFFYELKYGLKYDFLSDVTMLSEYIFSYNTNRALTPSTAQMTELENSIKTIVGEDFDLEAIEDVKMIWVDFRGGTIGYWGLHHTRFMMIKYEGEWFWWPFC